MTILAVVPARDGSRRVPGKNVRPLAGRPLLRWTLDLALDLPDVCDVLVSTDGPAIAELAREAGALVPWMRPAELATDDARSIDVVLHALAWYERVHRSVDGVLMLQPTSPFRRRTSVLRGLAMFREDPSRPVIGVSPAPVHPMWCFRIDGDRLQPFAGDGGLRLRSQDLPPAYALNGGFYLATPDRLRREQSFFGDDMRPLVADGPEEAIDIDTETDWSLAEACARDLGLGR